MCGAPDCPRCFPGSYQNESRYEWIGNYFPGKRCNSCEHCTDSGADYSICAVLEGDAELDSCPALAAAERSAEDDR